MTIEVEDYKFSRNDFFHFYTDAIDVEDAPLSYDLR